uniref:Uncharacterized protein n=1 Tax=Caenorhabditis tropicalis TaxID=1561998 RepID=A0A1I7TU48_9PELO
MRGEGIGERERRIVEEKDSELYELAEINTMNYEKTVTLKEDVKRAEGEMAKMMKEVKKLEDRIEKFKEIIGGLATENTPVETEIEEDLAESYRVIRTEQPAQRTRGFNPLTVFGYQPPSQPLPELPQEHPLSAGNGKLFCYIRSKEREGFYKREGRVYRLHECGFKQRPMNYYAQPTAIFNK